MSEKRKGAIPIAVAKKVSQEHGCPIVLIFAIEADGCHYTVTTYGRTKPLCAWAAKLSSDIQQAVMAGKVLGDVEHAHNPYELIATLTRERDEARARIRTMRNALNGLIDVQNGPPLVQHEAEWRDAVLEAEEAAKPVAGDLWGTCCKCGAAVEYVGPESVACTNKACELAASAAKEGE